MGSPRDIEDLFQQNQEREQALKTLLKTRPSESRDVSLVVVQDKIGRKTLCPFGQHDERFELHPWLECFPVAQSCAATVIAAFA